LPCFYVEKKDLYRQNAQKAFSQCQLTEGAVHLCCFYFLWYVLKYVTFRNVVTMNRIPAHSYASCNISISFFKLKYHGITSS